MPEDSPSIYTIMAERVANAILGKINALIGSHNTNEQAHQDIRENIPSASSTIPSADTTTGGIGAGTAWARSDHTHPKSNLYAEASHNHTIANVADLQTTLDNKASTTDLTNGLQNIGAYTVHTVYNVSGTTSAYDISSGLSYAQPTAVFFLVKNNIGDNQANATLKYYPNGNNITILDTFSPNSASPIQQGVWKKDTWGLFFCVNNNTVQLRCVFYDSVDIDEIKNIINLLGIESLSYYIVSSVSKDSKRVTYNVDGNGFYDGNAFYLKVPYYETSTDVRVVIVSGSYYIKQGSNYITESQINGHLLKLRFNSGVFELLEIYDNDKLIPSFSDLSNVAISGSYNDLNDKPTIPTIPTNISSFNNDSGYITSSSVPNPSSTTPSADTTNGSVGDGTTWARSNHTHPKSNLYAEVSHTHSQYLTSHQDITGKEDKSNKVTSLSSSSTDMEYPSAKCVHDGLESLFEDTIDELIEYGESL